jgi:hypothetical protein
MLLSQKNNKSSSINSYKFFFLFFFNFFNFTIYAQGPLPLNNPPFTHGKPFLNKSKWKEIPEFSRLEYPKALMAESSKILRDFSIDSNNISYEFKTPLKSEKAQIFHIPFRVNLIDYKKNESGTQNERLYRLEGLLTWKAESKGQALVQIVNLVSDDQKDFKHLLELKNEIPLQLKKILETQSEIINSILSNSPK